MHLNYRTPSKFVNLYNVDINLVVFLYSILFLWLQSKLNTELEQLLIFRIIILANTRLYFEF
jgi:hypothetical protein